MQSDLQLRDQAVNPERLELLQDTVEGAEAKGMLSDD
jgi:hypothetical protein